MDGKFARPLIAQYQDPVEFFRDMLNFRKKVESSFSVSREAKKLRRVSSALVSLIVSGRRKMTQDRVDELTKLMNLTVQEKYFFKDWVRRL